MIKRCTLGYTTLLFVFLLFHTIVLMRMVYNTKETGANVEQGIITLDDTTAPAARHISAVDIDGPCFGITEDEISTCKKPEPPVVSPMVVNDPKNMNYSFLPASSYRARYDYALKDLKGAPEKTMITILTPFYNTPSALLRDAARCVLGQSLQLFEWIIVNDGSTDKSALEQLNYYRTLDPRIKIIDLPKNAGLPGARNEGVRQAKGKYLLLLDPDDQIELSYTEKAVWFLETHPQFDLTNAWSIGFAHKEFLWARGFQSGDANLRGNEITIATVMRTKVLRDVGAFDESLVMGMEDWDLWMRMADNGHWGYTLEEYNFWYRVSPPGKWKAIDDPKNFEAYVKSRHEKYKNAFTNGVPKVRREPPMKYAPIADISKYDAPVTLFNNQLNKCKPRIMVVLPTMEVGGADQFNFNFLQGLALEGWEITIVATKVSPNPWLSAFARLTGDIFILSNFLEVDEYPNFLVYLAKSRNPDVMFVTNSESGYLFVPYVKYHCPWLTVVDYVHSETPLWKDGGYARYSFGLADTLDRSIFASEHLRQYVIERGHIEHKTATVRIGIDPHTYKHNPEHRKEIRSMLGLPDNKMLIIYVARLADEKQPLMFAQIMKELSDKGRDFLAVSIGDGELFNELNETVHKTGISDKVKLWGAIPNKQVSKWMSAADIFFLPSKVEGISLAIYEAMSLGVTCVSSLVGGQAELVVDGVGFLVKPGSANEKQQYVTALDKLVADPDYTRQLGKASRQRIVDGFSSQDALQLLKKEFCVAAATNVRRQKSVAPVLREYSALVTDYFRLEGEAVSVWRDFMTLQHNHQALLDKINAQPEYPARPPSPIPDRTPEEVLKSINIKSLRVVSDVLEEKNIDREMEVTLKVNMAPYYRKNPKVVIPEFDHNEFMIRDNHDVHEWNNKIPYPFRQQQYVAELPNAFIGIGSSATIFDHERVFLLQKGSRIMFELPHERTPTCNLIKHKKLVNLIQIYHEFGHVMSEMIPRLSLIWKRFKADPEIKLLVPNSAEAKIIFETLLKISPDRMVYFDFGPDWNPCKVYYADTVYLPTPNPTGNPAREQMETLRSIFTPVYEKPKNLVVYFSRSGLPDRAVSNEQDLLVALRKALRDGDELVVLDPKHALEDTFHKMQQAKAIIGSHGSTLAPLIWADKGTKVIEFLHKAPWLHWWATATACEHEYWMVPVENTKHDAASFAAPVDLTVQTMKAALGYTK